VFYKNPFENKPNIMIIRMFIVIVKTYNEIKLQTDQSVEQQQVKTLRQDILIKINIYM